MIGLSFTPWRQFTAEYNKAGVQTWLHDVAKTSHFALRSGMEASRGGRLYTHHLRWVNGRIVPVGLRGAPHKASAPGAYPAVDSGRLKGSIRNRVTATEATIGTTAKHAKYMLGTKRIAKRKMSKEAFQAALPITRGRMQAFARFRHG